jgi:hypothetical protein
MFDRKQNCLYNMKKDINVDPTILLDQIINGKNYFIRQRNESFLNNKMIEIRVSKYFVF